MAGVGGVGDFFCTVEPVADKVVPNFGAISLLDLVVVVDVLVAVATAPKVDAADVFAGVGEATAVVCDIVLERLAAIFTCACGV